MNENIYVDFDDEKHRLEAEKDKPQCLLNHFMFWVTIKYYD